MKVVTFAGPPSSGKTSVLLWALNHLREQGLNCGVAKFDCHSSADVEIYRSHGYTAVAGLSAGQCPDHYYAANVELAFNWGRDQGLDLLVTESAGLCNRCSPYLKDVLAVCVIDILAGMNAPAKIGPLLKCADMIVVTKGDIVSQIEREVFAYRVRQLAPKAGVISVNGITGQGASLLARRMGGVGDVHDVGSSMLRFPMPSAICSYCIGETRVGREYQTGNIVPMFEDDLPPFRLPLMELSGTCAGMERGSDVR